MSGQAFSLTNKVALVTGGGRGIGRAISVGLAEAGAAVAVNYCFGRDSAEETVGEISQKGGSAIPVQADTRNKSSIDNMIQSVLDEYGGIDILVNNAGISAATPFVSISEEEWDNVINTNLRGYFLVAQSVVRNLIDQNRGGRIINVSSARQEQAWPGNAHYCASKGGIHMLTRVMALELGEYGITVNCISPGTILTDMNRKKFSDDEFRQQRIARIPAGRLGSPEDLVGAAILLSSDAADFITGASIMVDGGQTVW